MLIAVTADIDASAAAVHIGDFHFQKVVIVGVEHIRLDKIADIGQVQLLNMLRGPGDNLEILLPLPVGRVGGQIRPVVLRAHHLIADALIFSVPRIDEAVLVPVFPVFAVVPHLPFAPDELFRKLF